MKKIIVRILCCTLAIQLMFSQTASIVNAEDLKNSLIQELTNQINQSEQVNESEDNDNVDITDVDQDEANDLDNNNTVSDSSNDIKTEETEKSENNSSEEIKQEESLKVNLSVSLTHASQLKSEHEFKVSLENQNKTVSLSKIIRLLSKDNTSLTEEVKFEGLEKGTYTLTITSNLFTTYTQKIQIDKYDCAVQICTGQDSNENYGQMHYGDLNQDGKINKNDANEIVDAIEQKLSDSKYDLNDDKKVDLLDLSKAVNLYYIDELTSKEAVIKETVSTELLSKGEVSVSETTTVVGDNPYILEELIQGKNEEPLQLVQESGVISEETPIEVAFDFSKATEPVELGGLVIDTPSSNQITSGSLTIEYVENGETLTGLVTIGDTARTRVQTIGTATNENGQLVVRLNGQIAVKKVTLKITSVSDKNKPLAEISKVEFVNDMASHIPPPTLDIPQNIEVIAGNQTITLNWKKANNVTGYEVIIRNGNEKEYKKVNTNSIEITMFKNKKLKNKTTYQISVRSVNGDWRSEESKLVEAIPMYDTIPDAPDDLTLKGGFQVIEMSWKAPKDDSADYYKVYYKKSNEQNYITIDNVKNTSYTLKGLEDETTYEIYVTSVNHHGEGPKSQIATATTTSLKPAIFTQYQLLNMSNGDGELSQHIVSASVGNGYMVNSKLDNTGNSALGLFDNDYESYWQTNTWETGGYNDAPNGGVKVNFDSKYTIDEIRFVEYIDQASFPFIRLYYYNENNELQRMSFQWKTTQMKDSNGRVQYRLKFDHPITVNSLTIGFARGSTSSPGIQLSELKIYKYDSLEDDIQALYKDSLHLSLQSNVNEQTLQNLQERLDTPINGDYHPDRDVLQKELDAAKVLFKDQTLLDDIFNVSSAISAQYDSQLKTGGLNAWQPLGVVAKAGEQLIVYVGKEGASTGASTPLQLVATQQHSESGKLSKVVANLKVGRNEISIPELISTNVEKGGALYIKYTGSNKNDKYAVRVSGGTKIPTLNLHGITDNEEITVLIKEYVQQLKEHVANLQTKHNEDHSSKILFFNTNPYDEKTCIYNATDILFDGMMISIPASQALVGLGDDVENNLKSTIESMQDMLILFYQNKGLTNDFAEGTSSKIIDKNKLPSQHLNIRYMKMFSGAFMYAGGDHIGIEWNETAGLMLQEKVQISEDGKITKGHYFGWGIAHEIGHQINQGAYAVKEVTNNYFSLLAQADGTNNGVRFGYDAIYDKVTSGAIGYSGDVFTSLAMYWQLHLAYDNGYAQKTYENYTEVFKNLIFARVDSYARDPSAFKGEKSLVIGNDVDQNLMRLVSAATEKDLTEFFNRWGLIPDADTKLFMSQFDVEARAIYYINDDAKTSTIEKTSEPFANKEVISSINMTVNNSDVTLVMTPNVDTKNILGYEVVRVSIERGNVKKEVVGFTTSNTFTDSVNLGSRAVSYEVYAIDQETNRSKVKTTESTKIISDGSYDKNQFEVTTNMVSDLDHKTDASINMPCETQEHSAISMVLDDNKVEEYIGKSSSTLPYVKIDLKQQLEVSAIRYFASSSPIKDYKIEVSSDDKTYTTVAEGTFNLNEGSQTIYFSDNLKETIVTYEIRYIKVSATGQKNEEISISEFDILGPSGDNVEFDKNNGEVYIGKLSETYYFDETNKEYYIPKDSIVFIGSYKGHPAYNSIILFDQNGNIVGGVNENGEIQAEQIILAPNPGNALLGEVSEGKWIYWITPDNIIDSSVKQVRVELYRVNNAETNEGERMTSDTTFVQYPSELKEIVIEK